METRNAHIATVEGTDSATVQLLFAGAISRWRRTGARIAGVIEETHGLPGRLCNAGSLREIGSGRPHSIYLENPPTGRSCHIDSSGAEDACVAVLAQIEDSDLVVLSKFGKLEAGRSGLFRAFEAAIAAGKPVLTTVSEKHRTAWQAFAPDAVVLPSNSDALDGWWARVHV